MNQLTVKDIVDTMREVMKVQTAGEPNGGTNTACTGGILLTILHDAIPQVVAMRMPGLIQMADQFIKIFEGLTLDDAQFAATQIISNNDSGRFDHAFRVLQHLMEKYPNEIVKRAIPGYYDRSDSTFSNNTEKEIEAILAEMNKK